LTNLYKTSTNYGTVNLSATPNSPDVTENMKVRQTYLAGETGPLQIYFELSGFNLQ